MLANECVADGVLSSQVIGHAHLACLFATFDRRFTRDNGSAERPAVQGSAKGGASGMQTRVRYR